MSHGGMADQKIFEQEKMPEEWGDSVIVPIFKEKGTSRIV